MKKIKALVGCQIQGCAEQVSYHLDMVKLWNEQPICQQCYNYHVEDEDAPDWHDLPEIRLKDLCE